MSFACTIAALAVALLLATGSESKFSNRKSKELLAAVSRTDLAKGDNRQLIKGAVKTVKRSFKNCRPRVCFALDGSSSISSSDYKLQANFVQLVAAVLGALDGSQFAAAQYGAIVQPISPLTDKLLTRKGFLRNVGRSKQVRAALTFIAPGLQYCVSNFAIASGNSDNDKIVLLGDGGTTFGDDANSPFGAVQLAKNFRKAKGNDICAGLVGETDKKGKRLFIKITGGKSKVVAIPSWTRIGSALMAIVSEICT